MKNGRIRGPVRHLVDLPKPEDLSPLASSSVAAAEEVRASAPIRPTHSPHSPAVSKLISPPGLSPDSKGFDHAVLALRSAAGRLSEPGQAPPQVTAMMRSVLALISLRDTVNLQRGRGGQV